MLVKGCGVDIVEIARIAKAIERPNFREKIYTAQEREFLKDRSAQSWAARFAAKEAVMKALGRGWQQGVSFQNVEIRSNEWGQPSVHLLGEAQKIAQNLGVTRFTISLSHSKELAIAYVIALGED
ncbi:MAG: holo-ACP synthase [Firmicutes bacterium]|nr:holo-ACP synthase [Bacillota bacterium]